MLPVHLDACLFSPHTRAGVIAHRLDDAKVIFRDKVRFPYDRLDEGLRAAVPAVQDSADQLTFGNNSSLRVSTSMRSGTLQLLHVSEFGKICAQYPDKAREIVTGALNTVEAGQFVVIESTAEGQEGAFYDMAQKARARALSGQPLTEPRLPLPLRPVVGRPGLRARRRLRGDRGGTHARVPEPRPSRPLRRERQPRPLRDQPRFLFGQCRANSRTQEADAGQPVRRDRQRADPFGRRRLTGELRIEAIPQRKEAGMNQGRAAARVGILQWAIGAPARLCITSSNTVPT